MKKTITLFFVAMLLTACSNNDRKNELTFKTDNIEFAEEINTCSLVKKVNGKEVVETDIKKNVITKDNYRVSCSKVNTENIGKQKIYYDFNGKMYQLIVNVVDTTPPEITILNKPNGSRETPKPKPIDYVTAKDSAGVASLTIEGDFDSEIKGEYPLKVVAVDNNGNTSEKEFVYVVLE